MAKRRIAILFGGQSAEHDVSRVSAQSVAAALNPHRYEICPILVNRDDGRWLGGDTARTALLGERNDTLQTVELGADGADLLPLLATRSGSVDVIFPVMHGPMGEDGTVQGLLELLDLPYVGCGVAASAVAMDKVMSKALLQDAGVPVARYRLIWRHQWRTHPNGIESELERDLGFPMFIKPANMGSSVGISRVENQAELAKALALAAYYDRRLLAEQGVPCRELEVSVLGNDDPKVSVIGEIVPDDAFYSYEAKYADGSSSRLLIPAPLTDAQRDEIVRLAIQTFTVLDCSGLARVDFLMNTETDEILVNEVNTMPGFTPISMYPKLWAASGLDYPDLLDRLIDLAIERHQERQDLRAAGR